MSNADLIKWLRGLADKGGKGTVDNIDARALGRCADALAAREWRPIETAPLDGTEILGYGYWAGEINGPDKISPRSLVIAWTGMRTDFPGYEWTVVGTDAYAAWFAPTHWQPLPPLPTEEPK